MIRDIWMSFRRMPLWVQVWMVAILVPANTASILFVGEPWGLTVAALAIGGMLPNLAIMMAERGLSKAMAIPHLVFWVPLVALLIWLLAGHTPLTSNYLAFLACLLIIDTISLAFDIPDALKWQQGERDIA